MLRSRLATAIAVGLIAVNTISAQSISIGLRGTGSFPTGAFSETSSGTNEAFIEGAKSGFGYGLDVGVALGMIGAYAGFDRINFDCEASSCTSDAKYKLQGVAVGLRVTPSMASRFRPYLKAGVTFNSLEGAYGAQAAKLTTDRAPGYEFGIGGNVLLGGLLALTPQLRYVGQNLKAKIPGVVVEGDFSPILNDNSGAVNYFTFDVGLTFITPFGSRR